MPPSTNYNGIYDSAELFSRTSQNEQKFSPQVLKVLFSVWLRVWSSLTINHKKLVSWQTLLNFHCNWMFEFLVSLRCFRGEGIRWMFLPNGKLALGSSTGVIRVRGRAETKSPTK